MDSQTDEQFLTGYSVKREINVVHSTDRYSRCRSAIDTLIGLRTGGDEQILLRTLAVYEANASNRQLGLTHKVDQFIHALFSLGMVQLHITQVLTRLNKPILCSPQLTIIITRSLAVTKTPCDCCVGQFWPNVTGRLYFADIIGLSSTCDVIGLQSYQIR